MPRFLGGSAWYGATKKLRVENRGPSEAREVQITIDGVSLAEHPIVVGGQKEARQIGPGGSVEYMIALSKDTPERALQSRGDVVRRFWTAGPLR